MIAKEHFKGSIHSIILYLLKDNDELYGYEICQLVDQKTASKIQFTEGAIYPSLHKLQQKGFIASRKTEVNGRTRKYYHITAKGLKECERQLESLSNLYSALGAIFGSAMLRIR